MTKLNFLHLTDSHILRETDENFLESSIGRPAESSLGSPAERLIGAIQYSKKVEPELDFIVISGDLVHEGDTSDYAYLKHILDEETPDIPVFLALGNHDVTEAYWEVFAGKHNCTDKLYYETTIKGYRVIVLDSSHDKSGIGMVDEEQLVWLKNVLSTPAENGSIVIVHHPVETGAFDLNFGLVNSKEILDVIDGTDTLAVVSGHIHRNQLKHFGKVALSTVEGTAFGADVDDEEIRINTRTAFNICTLDENGLSVHHVRYPDEVNVMHKISLTELTEILRNA
jgi:3',5'-cyclic AMP phosphodiesterase CpdA